MEKYRLENQIYGVKIFTELSLGLLCVGALAELAAPSLVDCRDPEFHLPVGRQTVHLVFGSLDWVQCSLLPARRALLALLDDVALNRGATVVLGLGPLELDKVPIVVNDLGYSWSAWFIC